MVDVGSLDGNDVPERWRMHVEKLRVTARLPGVCDLQSLWTPFVQVNNRDAAGLQLRAVTCAVNTEK